MVSAIKEQFAHSSFLSCNNKQARLEDTTPLSRVFVFSFAWCLPDPAPRVWLCSLRQDHTSPESPEPDQESVCRQKA